MKPLDTKPATSQRQRVRASVDLRIRVAQRADLPTLIKFAAQSFYDAFAPTNTPANMQVYMSTAFTLEQFTAEWEDDHATFYLAKAGRRLVGYAKLYRGVAPECVAGERVIELSRLYVETPYIGHGVGAQLMQHCLEVAQREGFTTMFLGVWEHNPRAQVFYQRWGFTRVGEHVFYMGDDAQIDWWLMRTLP